MIPHSGIILTSHLKGREGGWGRALQARSIILID